MMKTDTAQRHGYGTALLKAAGPLHVVLLATLVVLVLVAGVLAPGLLSASHLLEMVRQSVPLILTAIGQSAVILTGGIDVSVGEVITLVNIVSTDLMRGNDANFASAVLIVLCLGILVGTISGALIAYTRVPPLVVTFGMSFIIRGAYLLYSGGAPKGYASPMLRAMSVGRWGTIPFSVLILAGLLIILHVVNRRTTWRQSIAYIGSNPLAAFYSGVPVASRLIITYAFCSFMASLAGLLLTGYIGVGNFNVGGDPYMLNSIASSVIGGTTFDGSGTVTGTVLGSLIMTVLGSIMTSLGLGESGKQVIRGLIILVMVSVYAFQHRNRS